ncbi:hypothetical protein ALP72_05109, partial [Pseudomonas coronafaciens pv. coronafaciens]
PSALRGWPLTLTRLQSELPMTTSALYLDYAATTPVDEQVIEAMVACMGREGHFGNPASSGHGYGQVARQ